jgi:membrane-bound lytic murein transglycosylase D
MLKPNRILNFLIFVFLLTGCSGTNSRIRGEGGLSQLQGQGGLLGGPATSSGDYSKTLDQEVLGVNLKHKDFDIPVVVNPEVEMWMRFFTERGREHFTIYLERMGAMIPLMIPQLREAGMPEDLIYLSMIESGFSMQAKSHAGAVGPWQFIKSTGRIYDMRIDSFLDERRDPRHATQAAIRYLRNLYEEFGDWHLAAAAYNSGEVRIRNAIQRLGTRDFWKIARDRKALRRETRDYVPKMIAAAILGKNAELFGFTPPSPDPKWMNTVEVRIPGPEDLRTIARAGNVDAALLRELNPELSHPCTPPVRSYMLRVPSESQSAIQSAIANNEFGKFENFRRHTIKKGDSLSRLARRYGVEKDTILSLNNYKSIQDMRLGHELILPGTKLSGFFEKEPRILASRSTKQRRFRSRRQVASTISDSGAVIYTVKQGDTLYDISRKYAVSVNEIKDWNAISRSKNLQPGRRLKLYVRNDSTRI